MQLETKKHTHFAMPKKPSMTKLMSPQTVYHNFKEHLPQPKMQKKAFTTIHKVNNQVSGANVKPYTTNHRIDQTGEMMNAIKSRHQSLAPPA